LISTSDFKKGVRFEHEDAPWQVMEHSVHNPSARGAATLVKVKARNLVTDQVLQKSFKSGEMFQEPDLQRLKVQFLYEEGSDLVFMDQETYEQYNVPREKLGDSAVWMSDGFELALLQYNGRIINVELPQSVIAKVSTVEGGARGDTASGKVTSRAELEKGVVLQVPTFIKEGNQIKVDPATNTYLSRE
jgi:elongation factor P